MAKKTNSSFGFSVSGTKEQRLAGLDGVSTEGRPKHALKVLELTREIVQATADHTRLSISINTHVGIPPVPAKSIEE